MCVILYKPKNKQLPNKNILLNCFNNNGDGAGYTFNDKKDVIIKKGYKDFNTFYKDLLNDYKEHKLDTKNLIIHFRIGTSGGLTKEKTQPFKITNNIKELNKLYIRNKKASVVHNGVLYDYTYNKNNSDTQNYIKDFLQPLLNSKIKLKNDLITKSLNGTSKLAILNNNGNVDLYGDFILDKGIFYSNKSYNNYSYNSDTKTYNFSGSECTLKQPTKYTYYNYNDWSKYDYE